MVSNYTNTVPVDLAGWNPSKWSIKIEHRTKNRMKITFKLDKSEAEAFTNFQNITKPDELDESKFLKSIFFLGLATLETNISKKITDKLDQQEDVVIPQDETSDNESN
tara:strand:- start:859 stop:1182 length:324 start_codon:yes stop_codon:yes gene_type:complete